MVEFEAPSNFHEIISKDWYGIGIKEKILPLAEKYDVDYIDEKDVTLSSSQLVNKYKEELIGKGGLCKYDNDTKDVFGFVNTWWVFGEVAKDLGYEIFMAEVENVGYKRTKRSEKPRPNDLYRVDKDGDILVDDGVKETALDYLREVQWD